MRVWALRLSCEGAHKRAPALQNTKIPREEIQEREERMNIVAAPTFGAPLLTICDNNNYNYYNFFYCNYQNYNYNFSLFQL